MKCITVAENGRTPVDPAALTWTVFMGLRTYEIARITEDRSTGKWRCRDEVLGDREEAVSKVEKLLPGLLMLAIHKAMAPPGFEFHGSVDDTPIYKMDDEDGWDIFTLGKLLDLGRAISYRRDNFFGLLPPAHRKKDSRRRAGEGNGLNIGRFQTTRLKRFTFRLFWSWKTSVSSG